MCDDSSDCGSVNGRNVIIVDDLCVYGGTFLLAARKLKDLGAKTVTLVVTHSESALQEGGIPNSDDIDFVVTSNTMFDLTYL